MASKVDLGAAALFKRRYQGTAAARYQCINLFGGEGVTYDDLVKGRCSSVMVPPMLKELRDDARAVIRAISARKK